MATSDDPTSRSSALAQTYARALFELATEGGSLAEVAAEMSELVELLGSQPDLAALFAHRVIDVDRRARTLETIFKGRVHETTYRFLCVLNRKGRLGHVGEIHAALEQILKTQRGEVDVEVSSAAALSGDQMQQVSERLGSVLGKTAVLHPRVDPSLIGGLKIRVADRLIDASVSAQLRRIRRSVLERGAEAARSGSGLIEA
ncbi:MAG: ATP synthase F1 subunit delta [Phycisphaeraceae bacterium]|nr:ATP synthase F1 subunit delta [Phycisphaeraceae bacterium]